jgi:serine/threonine protein phosphatase 1
MNLPTTLEYPLIAIGDLHGRIEWLDKLITKLEQLPEWPSARLVFLGDLVDRTETVKQLVSRVIELIAAKPGSTCVMGNHDLALVNAAALHDRPASAYWVKRYGGAYDHKWTFSSYLDGHSPDYLPAGKWNEELERLKAGMPSEHREFLASLPWMAEAEGHIFLHCGLSPELDCPPSVQLECLRRKVWDRAVVNPRFGTNSDRLFTSDYPVWLGADRRLSANPLPFPGKVQVSGHEKITSPDANAVRIRIDTSGGVIEPLTGCLLRGPAEPPMFVFSNG